MNELILLHKRIPEKEGVARKFYNCTQCNHPVYSDINLNNLAAMPCGHLFSATNPQPITQEEYENLVFEYAERAQA